MYLVLYNSVTTFYLYRWRMKLWRHFIEAEKEQKPNSSLMFYEVYNELPVHLQKQKEQMWVYMRNHPSNYALDKFLKVITDLFVLFVLNTA